MTPKSNPGESKTASNKQVVELSEYIEYLLELTIMAHERSPRGYTDPQEKEFRLGQRDSLLRVKERLER